LINKNRESLSGLSSQSGVDSLAMASTSNKNLIKIKGSKIKVVGGYA
jgi:hypothetical protein